MASVPVTSVLPSSSIPNPNPPLLPPPSNSQIEAVIQMATSAAPSSSDPRIPGRDTRTQLFVGNLPYRVRWQDLKDLFRKAGTVLRADVSLGPDNRSRGYGTVLLATAEDAAKAVEMFNGYNWQTRILEVRPDRLPPDFDGSNHVPVPNSNSLPTSSAVPPYPALFPPISISPSPPVYSAGSLDEFDVQALVDDKRPRAGSSAASRTLYVGNLPFHCQWQDLKDLFRQGGTIVRADVALGPDGRSRGYGTVSFANDADAERALQIFNGYEFGGRVLKVHYDKFSGQHAGSPTPLSTTSPTKVHHAHPNAPTHIAMPPPPPSAAFEHFGVISHPQSPFENIFGQISPYDIFPPHIAAVAANAAARAYMNNQQLTPPLAPPLSQPNPLAAVSISTASSLLSGDSTDFSPAAGSDNATKEEEAGASALSRRPAQAKKTPAKAPASPSNNHNHNHPGPIALPSPPIIPFSRMSNGPPSSPLQGLPPITPSMPPFTFVPPTTTPPLSAHFLSPGVGLTPFAPPSPGTYFHPPPPPPPAGGPGTRGQQRHPLGQVWNVAPGAPGHVRSPPLGSPPAAGYFAPGLSPHEVRGAEAQDYFSVAPRPPPPPPPPPLVAGDGYFSPMTAGGPVYTEPENIRKRREEGPEQGGGAWAGVPAETEDAQESAEASVVGEEELEGAMPVPHRTHSDGSPGSDGDPAAQQHLLGGRDAMGAGGGGGGGERRASWSEPRQLTA